MTVLSTSLEGESSVELIESNCVLEPQGSPLFWFPFPLLPKLAVSSFMYRQQRQWRLGHGLLKQTRGFAGIFHTYHRIDYTSRRGLGRYPLLAAIIHGFRLLWAYASWTMGDASERTTLPIDMKNLESGPVVSKTTSSRGNGDTPKGCPRRRHVLS